jgi:hypothetical protein
MPGQLTGTAALRHCGTAALRHCGTAALHRAEPGSASVRTAKTEPTGPRSIRQTGAPARCGERCGTTLPDSGSRHAKRMRAPSFGRRFPQGRPYEEVERAIFQWITWCNEERLHSALDYVPPAEYEGVFWHSQEAVPQSA